MIPPSIVALTFLSHLNLSNNKLSGRIPIGNQLRTLIDPSIYSGNKDLCGPPLPKNCSNPDDPTITPMYEAAHEPNKVWFYMDIMCCSATGFWGVIVVLILKKQWRHKLFIFAEESMDKIQDAIMVRVNKMRIGRGPILDPLKWN
ncbi:putative transferase [Helianthus anomalus]